MMKIRILNAKGDQTITVTPENQQLLVEKLAGYTIVDEQKNVLDLSDLSVEDMEAIEAATAFRPVSGG